MVVVGWASVSHLRDRCVADGKGKDELFAGEKRLWKLGEVKFKVQH